MIGRVLVVAGGIAAGAVAAAAVWAKRKIELEAEALEATGGTPTIPDPAEMREQGLTPLPSEPGSVGQTAAAVSPGEREGNDLQAVKGIGDVSEERLAEQGVTSFAQIAAWSEDDLEAVASAIRVSAERIRREDWVGQARELSGTTEGAIDGAD
jgi:large subunit ribosomal protein L21